MTSFVSSIPGSSEGARVTLEVSDDGKDLQSVELLFKGRSASVPKMALEPILYPDLGSAYLALEGGGNSDRLFLTIKCSGPDGSDEMVTFVYESGDFKERVTERENPKTGMTESEKLQL